MTCQARSRIEERIEVSLTGAVPSSASGYRTVRTRAITPKEQQRAHTADGVVVGEGEYEIICKFYNSGVFSYTLSGWLSLIILWHHLRCEVTQISLLFCNNSI